MYEGFDVIAAAEEEARATALKDRLRYRKFVEAAERFAAANDLIVSGGSATRLLLADGGPGSGRPRPPEVGLDSFQYEFSSGQAVSGARALGDALYAVDPQGLGHYVQVLTKIAGTVFTIEVDGRLMFTVTALPVYRGVKTADVVIPSTRPAQFAEGVKLACMGPRSS